MWLLSYGFYTRDNLEVSVRVLIVDDDPATRDVLERGLREEFFRVEAVSDSEAAEDTVRRGAFDAIVLDVMLPGHDGFAVCRRLRTRGIDTPIMMLTGRHGLADRVRGLDAGADDYLAKPFAFEELVARLRALTRRGRTRHLDVQLSYGPITLNQHTRGVRVNDEAILLTATEFRLLEHLLRRAEGLVTRGELAGHVWGDEAAPQSNVIDVYISHLRRKLGPAGRLLRTVRLAGYTLAKDRP
jgi:two-component system response regulator MprA